jgi:hypothetical protein
MSGALTRHDIQRFVPRTSLSVKGSWLPEDKRTGMSAVQIFSTERGGGLLTISHEAVFLTSSLKAFDVL